MKKLKYLALITSGKKNGERCTKKLFQENTDHVMVRFLKQANSPDGRA